MRNKRLLAFLFSVVTSFSTLVFAENSQDFGDYVVHFNALSTSYLAPSVTRQYGIERSKNRGMINIAVLNKVLGTPGKPVQAEISATATNLTGQKRRITLREIQEDTAIYYIGEFPISHEEVLRFNINVQPKGLNEAHEVNFRQTFYTE
ncbi:MAG: DUF4426 domain-containing protein [Thiogranum sp.]|nr:DUF4426 domain-containing protein [Thiogranum sp.]